MFVFDIKDKKIQEDKYIFLFIFVDEMVVFLGTIKANVRTIVPSTETPVVIPWVLSTLGANEFASYFFHIIFVFSAALCIFLYGILINVDKRSIYGAVRCTRIVRHVVILTSKRENYVSILINKSAISRYTFCLFW